MGERQKVIIIGAGPTGLSLGLSLQKYGINPVIIDKRPDPDTQVQYKSKALSVHAHTAEILEDLGVMDKIEERSIVVLDVVVKDNELNHIANINVEGMPSKYQGMIALPQYHTEEVLRNTFNERGGTIKWNHKLEHCKQNYKEVTLKIKDTVNDESKEIVTEFLVGCDGSHSTVRRATSINWVGEDLNRIFTMISCKVKRENKEKVLMIFKDGHTSIFIPEPNGKDRILIQYPIEKKHELPQEPTLEFYQDLMEIITDNGKIDVELSDPTWMTHFEIRQRYAEELKEGRILIAGDAAHSHSPVGGRGMNTGIQDGYNLGWKLASVIKGFGKTTLIDSYNVERKFIAEELIKSTGLQTKLAINNNYFVSHLRKIALSSVNVIQSIQFINTAILSEISMLNVSYVGNSNIVFEEPVKGMFRMSFLTSNSYVKSGSRLPEFSVKLLTLNEGQLNNNNEDENNNNSNNNAINVDDIQISEDEVRVHELFSYVNHIICISLVNFLNFTEEVLDSITSILSYLEYYEGLISTYIAVENTNQIELLSEVISSSNIKLNFILDETHSFSTNFQHPLIVVRPDKYVGALSSLSLTNLQNYLEQILY
eukprot:TRINITY_DN6134_c0_g1_i1.p1 TRINITY_DN6134_c0_g1~~TRINITY_DN6134_c0_g1_i1.p1  ORF type:complete len:597 (+),score=196.74 TRINITY_DN6134_c0_g1_i1:46-1836(+)